MDSEPHNPDLPLIRADVAKTEALVARRRITAAPEWEQAALEREWSSQSKKLARVFASALGLNEQEYVESLPKFEARPDTYRGTFDCPLIVPFHPELGTRDMANLAGFKFRLSAGEVTSPEQSYTTWIKTRLRRGTEDKPFRITDLGENERGGTVHDGIAYYIMLGSPRSFDDNYLLPGSEALIHCEDYHISAPYTPPYLDDSSYPLRDRNRVVLTAGREISSLPQAA